MKKLFIIIFFTLSYFILQAQPATILPDTLNINGHYTLGLDLVPLANKEFAIITKDNNDPFATFTKIDSMGTLISNSSSQPFGNNKIILSASNCMMQLKNKNWLRTAFVQTSGIVDNYNGLIVFNETLTDTVYTRLSRFNFLGTPRNSAYGWATYSRDSNSIWIVGACETPLTDLALAVAHLDTNFNIISSHVLNRGTRFVSPLWIIPTHDGKCLISGQAQPYAGNTDEVFVAKASDSGFEWYKEYGTPVLADYDAYIYRSSTDTTYKLIYAKGREYYSTNGDAKVDIMQYELNNAGNIISSDTLIPVHEYARIFSQKQFTDGSILLGVAGINTNYLRIFTKINRYGQVQWHSEIPAPPMGQFTIGGRPYPACTYQTPDGGFLCTGAYENYDLTPLQTVWIGKMDSTGCWENCTVSTASPSPSKGGELLMVYPNPANGVLHLTYPTTELPKRIVINDVLGNKVSEVLPSFGGVGGGSEIVLPLSIANGVYSLSIYYENNAFQSTKFVLLR